MVGKVNHSRDIVSKQNLEELANSTRGEEGVESTPTLQVKEIIRFQTIVQHDKKFALRNYINDTVCSKEGVKK